MSYRVILLWGLLICQSVALAGVKAKQTDTCSRPCQVNVASIAQPVVVSGEITVKSDNHDVERADAEELSKAWSDHWLVGLTGALAVATFGLWVATYMLAKQAKADAATQAEQTKKALEHSQDAAFAAKKSADGIALVERAYVFVSDIRVGSHRKERKDLGQNIVGHEVFITVEFKNHGKTPAMLTEVFADLYFVEYPEEVTQVPGTIFAPGKWIGAGESDTFFKKDLYIPKMPPGKSKTYFMGSIHYIDVLGEKRTTNFCWQMDHPNLEFSLSLHPIVNSWV